MVTVSDDEFETFITHAMDELPQEYIKNMKNVAIIWEDEPTPEQRTKLHLMNGQLLYGLYEGIPRPQRFGREDLMPDKITLFKRSMEWSAETPKDLREQVKRTLWHEIAHYYGLDHKRIAELESK